MSTGERRKYTEVRRNVSPFPDTPLGMRLALFSDIHGNLHALQACLADAQAQGADRYAFLGDLVGYGADPGGVIDAVAAYLAKGAVAVRGNHDDAISGESAYMNSMARTAIAYTKRVLTHPQIEWLAHLPLMVREENRCLVHASAAVPEKYPYIDSPAAAAHCASAAECAYTFCGHMHDQRLYFAAASKRMTRFQPTPGITVPMPPHRQWVVLVGSVGQPRDHDSRAAYALFDRERAVITFFRVAYDHHAAAARIREVGLPEAIAYRIEHGI